MIICHLQRLTEWRLNGCVNSYHLQATMAQLRQRAFKGLKNDKETEWGGRRDNVSKGDRDTEKRKKKWIETGSEIFQVETADDNWQV